MNPQYESNDIIRLQYSTDGGATYNTLAQFVGNNPGGQGFMQLDADRDGLADGTQTATNTLDVTMRDFAFNIPGSPAALLVRVQVDERGGSEELAFDNIRVTGVLNTVSPPTLSALESTALPYAEGQSATQVTSTLTVTNPGGTMLSRASVTISNGRATSDLLAFTPSNGIIGSYSSSTGVLALTGNATAAAYQAVLRSVTFQNSNSTNAPAGTRTLDFVVYTGTVSSNQASRNVTLTASLNPPATLPYREDFDTDGEGTRYGSNSFFVTDGIVFERTNANPRDVSAVPTTFSNISNGYYFLGENTTSSFNPSTVKVGSLTTQSVDATSYSNLHFQIRLGASPASAGAIWQTKHFFRLSYRVGGSSGTWVLFGSFRGTTTVVNGVGDLRQDTDLTNLSGTPTGPAVTPALTNFDFALPAALSGQVVDFKLDLSNDDSRSDFAFDLIQVTGTLNNPPTALTLSNSSVAENQPAGSVVGNFTSTDPDAGQIFSYSLVAGSGSTDNATFQIVGNQLRTSTVLNYEAKSSYSIRVRTTDSGSPAQSLEKVFIVTVTNVNELLATVSSQTNVSCNGGATGSATVTASGESAPYSYAWRNLTTNTPLSQTTPTVSGLSAGVYSVTVTATSSGFTATTGLTISQPAALSLTTTPANVGRLGASTGTASVSVSGGTPAYSYDWSPGNPTGDGTSSISSLSAGTYSVSVTDANGCTATSATTVGTDPDLTLTLYARPSTLTGKDPVSVVVDVEELNGVSSSGLITVRVSKDPTLLLNFDSGLSSLSGRPVQNSRWSLSSDGDYYILTTSQGIGGSTQLSFGLSGVLTGGGTSGVITCSATVTGGGESRLSNNVDADKIEYFQP